MLDRRRFVKIAGAGVLGLGLVGCGGNGAQEAPDTEAAQASSTTEAATTTSEPTKRKAAFVCLTKMENHGPDLNLGCAVADAADELGWDFDCKYDVGGSDVDDVVRSYVDDGYDLICMPEYLYLLGYVDDIVSSNPDVNFCVFNDTTVGSNVTSILPDSTQIGQLAGSLAALLSKTAYVTFLGQAYSETSEPVVKDKADAFSAAANKINSSILATYNLQAGVDEEGAQHAVEAFVNHGDNDVIYCDSPCVAAGASMALDSYDGCFAIGSIDDCGQYYGDKIACSVVIDYKGMVEQAMKSVEAGKFGNEVIEGDLANGFIKVGTFSSAVDASVQDQYLSIVDQIKGGTFM